MELQWCSTTQTSTQNRKFWHVQTPKRRKTFCKDQGPWIKWYHYALALKGIEKKVFLRYNRQKEGWID